MNGFGLIPANPMVAQRDSKTATGPEGMRPTGPCIESAHQSFAWTGNKNRAGENMAIQLGKEITRNVVMSLAPQYAEMLRDLQSPTRWANVSSRLDSYLQGPAVAGYVSVYDDESRIHKLQG